MIIGLTGGSGTGKSSAARFFEKEGFVIVDFDRISREVTAKGSECLKELEENFGSIIIDADGNLNRKALGEIVFADEEKLALLNRIEHKYILKKSDEIERENEGKNLVFDAPLLFEAGLEKKCDYVVSILAEREKRISRICKRDSLTRESAQKRINSQPSDNFYEEKSDFCVYNNESAQKLEFQICKILRSIKLNEYSQI